MVDLRKRSSLSQSADDPGFAARSRGASGPMIRSREGRKLVMVVIATILAIATTLIYGGKEPVDTTGPEANAPTLVAMDEPDLAALEALPSWSDLSAHAEDIAFWNQHPEQVATALRGAGLSSATLLWARSRVQTDQNAASPPIPQGVNAAELANGGKHSAGLAGSQIMVSGIITGLVEATITGAGPEGTDERWYRLNVLADGSGLLGGNSAVEEGPRVYIHILAPASSIQLGDGPDDVAIGVAVSVVGRYLGREPLATLTGDSQFTPVVVAMRVNSQAQTNVASLLGLGRPAPPVTMGRFVPDPAVFDQVDDKRQLLEIGPYYYLLGQVKVDQGVSGIYADAEDGNAFSEKLHNDPAEFRGQPFHVEGFVWDAWDDYDVALHQPYDIQRVIRIRMWKRVFGVPHEKKDWEGNITIVDNGLHVYELAVLAEADTPLPKRGDLVQATGRFLKVHGYPRNVSPMRDQMTGTRAQSDGVWFKMFVTSDYRILPPPGTIDWMQIGTIFLIIAFSAIAWMAILIKRDDETADDYKTQVRRLRQARRDLRKRTVVTESEGGDEALPDVATIDTDSTANTPPSDDLRT